MRRLRAVREMEHVRLGWSLVIVVVGLMTACLSAGIKQTEEATSELASPTIVRLDARFDELVPQERKSLRGGARVRKDVQAAPQQAKKAKKK